MDHRLVEGRCSGRWEDDSRRRLVYGAWADRVNGVSWVGWDMAGCVDLGEAGRGDEEQCGCYGDGSFHGFSPFGLVVGH